ncbi:hypothetical protein E2C01_067049 [Portunus trituberculatus]|uniref:Uncharacterized protein n=1 Tax=Portunus trituberculatus TaxID=210409 RepID=A0A5B7HU02_PORTR|nr:hypothetical protein [Portunus trituberculatus]
MLLAAPWTGFFLHLMEEPSVGAEVVDEILREDVSESAESVKHISLAPDAPDLSLGSSPRRKYPLVVCVTRCDTSQETDDSRVVQSTNILFYHIYKVLFQLILLLYETKMI